LNRFCDIDILSEHVLAAEQISTETYQLHVIYYHCDFITPINL